MPEASITKIPIANAAALGLTAFGLTTVLLSLSNGGVLPSAGEPVVIPLALAMGGAMQIFGRVFEFGVGNTFGMTAFCSYGAFWVWFAPVQLMGHSHWIDFSAIGPTIGVALLLWGVLTLTLWISTLRLPKILFFVFLTLSMTFGLLGFGAIGANAALTHAGGWMGKLCGLMALYGSFNIVTNATFARQFIPLGERPVLAM